MTAVAGGSATITAACGSMTDTCAVTVANQVKIENMPTIKDCYSWYYVRELWVGGVEVKDYCWNSNALTLFVPETTNTQAAITFTLEWQGNAYSKDAEVEIVNGVGSYTLTEHDVSAPVINIAPYRPATGITLNKSELSFEGKGSETLIATVTPENSSDPVAWSTSNDKVATVDQNGLVTAVETGTATITATAGAYSATCIVTVVLPKTTVNFIGTGAEDIIGGTSQNAAQSEAFSFSVNKADGYKYEVAINVAAKGTAMEYPFKEQGTGTEWKTCFPTSETVTYNLMKGFDWKIEDFISGDVTFTVADIYIPSGARFTTESCAGGFKPDDTEVDGMSFDNLPQGTMLYFYYDDDDYIRNFGSYVYRINYGEAPTAKMTLTADADGVYTIPASHVVGDNLTVAVVKEAAPVNINFIGTGAEEVIGGTGQTANYGEAFRFSLNKADGYQYEAAIAVAAEGTAMEYPFKEKAADSTLTGTEWGTCFPTAETVTYNLMKGFDWEIEDFISGDVTFTVADIYIPSGARFTTESCAGGFKPDDTEVDGMSFDNLPQGTMLYFYYDDDDYIRNFGSYVYRINYGEAPTAKMTLTADADGVYTIPASYVVGDSLTVAVAKEAALAKVGDANGDGKVDALDAALVLQYAAGFEVTIDLAAADVNGDGVTNSLDAAMILQFAGHIIQEFPAANKNK